MSIARRVQRSARGWRMAVAGLVLAGTLTGCPSPPPAPPMCPTVERQDIDPPVEPSGVLPPTLPPGLDFSVHYSESARTNYVPAFGVSSFPLDAKPLAEATSSNGRWHLWAVAQGTDHAVSSFVAYKDQVWARDTTTTDPPFKVTWFNDAPGMFPQTLGRDGVGHPGNVAFVHIDDAGEGFVTAVDYHEVDTTFFGAPRPLPLAKARLHLSVCG